MTGTTMTASTLPENLFSLSPRDTLDVLDGAAEKIFTVTDGHKVCWRSWGPEQAAPVILIHGSLGSWRHWTRNIPALAEQYRVYAIDIPGFGDSDKLPEPVDRETLGRVVRDGIEQLVRDKLYHLVAFSFGGQVASEIVVPHAKRFISVNLVASGGIAPPVFPPFLSVKSKTGAERVATHRQNLKAMLIFDEARIDDLAIEIQEENTMLARANLSGLRSNASLIEPLRTVQLPLNAIWGERDQFAGGDTTSRTETVRKLQPHAYVHTLPGVGHWTMYEAAETFNPLLKSLMAKRTLQWQERE
jgi:pimeloyl-ACP methyl ester carboxylesterase